jgi:hypothetical protein
MIIFTREEAQQVLDALKHLCLHTVAIKGYDGEKVQPPIDMLKAKLKQLEFKSVPTAKLRELVEVQGRDGTWNYDPYFHGMYNGMEVMLAVSENREPVFRGAPERWLSKKGWVGLTDETYWEMWVESPSDVLRFAHAIEAKLKEKNI